MSTLHKVALTVWVSALLGLTANLAYQMSRVQYDETFHFAMHRADLAFAWWMGAVILSAAIAIVGLIWDN